MTLWIGSGPRPPAGAANHILWVDSDDPMVPATGRFVLMYHLLWELTHVCFEHSGLLKPDPRSAPTTSASRAATRAAWARWCSSRPTPSVRPWSAPPRARSGWTSPCSATSRPNDLVLVHAGAAITRLDRAR